MQSSAENYTTTNNNCITCRMCGRQLDRSQANTKKWAKKASFEHEIWSRQTKFMARDLNEIDRARCEWHEYRGSGQSTRMDILPRISNIILKSKKKKRTIYKRLHSASALNAECISLTCEFHNSVVGSLLLAVV